MEGTRGKVEMVKPVLVKAMIPLAISMAGFLFVRLKARRSSTSSQVNPLPNESREEFRDEESFHSLDSTSLQCGEDGEKHIFTGTHFTNPLACVFGRDHSDVEEEILGLRCRIQELTQREWRLETRFLNYCNVKERESALMELQNSLLLEMAHVKFLEREVSSMEAEHWRFEELVMEYLKILKQPESEGLKNRMLQRKVKNLSRKARRLSHVTREQKTQIKAREAEISRNQIELERRSNVVKALEGEIVELQIVANQLQEEKKQLLHNSDSPQITQEDFDRLVDELEHLQQDRSVEAKELIFLRWSNACLRHELMRRNQEQEQLAHERDLELEGNGDIIEHFGSENELDCSVLGQGECSPSAPTGDQAHSKRAKLIKKLKRWVEGSEKMKHKWNEKEKLHVNCLRRSLAFEREEEQLLPQRKSCSSA